MNWKMEDPSARRTLELERTAAAARVRMLRVDLEGLAGDAVDANSDDEHDPEGSTLAYERARVSALLTEAQDHVTALDRALKRLTAGSYSTCDRCGRQISSERLAALPATRTCFECAIEAS